MGLTEPPVELCCTSLPQQWGKPRGKEIKAVPAPSMIIVKPKMDRKRKPLKNSLIDNRLNTAPLNAIDVHLNVHEDPSKRIRHFISEQLKRLSHQLSSTQHTSHVGHKLWTLSTRKCIKYSSKFYSKREIVPVETVCEDLVFPKENGQSVLSEKYNTLIDTISNDEVKIIEEQNREQAQCEKWFKEREKRITASNFHRIVKRKAAINDKFFLSIMKPKPFTSKATSYGRNNEIKAKTHLSKLLAIMFMIVGS